MRDKRLIVIIFWLVLYSVLNFALKGMQSVAIVSSLALFWVCLLAYLYKRVRLKDYGITLNISLKPWLVICAILPALIAIINLIFGKRLHLFEYAGLGIVDFSLVLSAVLGEELFFRGVLLNEINGRLKSKRASIYIVTSLFAIFHIVNIATGMSAVEIALQLIFALSVGLLLTIIASYSGSIIIPILIHLAINLSSVKAIAFDNTAFATISIIVLIAMAIFGVAGVNREEIKE